MKPKKVYDIIQRVWGNLPNYEQMPEQYKTTRVVCTCKSRENANNMIGMYSKQFHKYEIIEREVSKNGYHM